MSNPQEYPCSPTKQLEGLPYIRRMCQKIRLHDAGTLHPDLHPNLGQGMDLWTCQFLGVDYDDLKKHVLGGADDEATLRWARENGCTRSEYERNWWVAFMNTVGFRDHITEKLKERKEESGLEARDDIVTMFDYIDADEGR